MGFVLLPQIDDEEDGPQPLPSEAFDGLQEKHREICGDVSRACVDMSMLDKDEKQRQFEQLQAGLMLADQLVKKMDIESKHLPKAQRAALLLKLKSHRAELAALKKEAMAAHKKNSKDLAACPAAVGGKAAAAEIIIDVDPAPSPAGASSCFSNSRNDPSHITDAPVSPNQESPLLVKVNGVDEADGDESKETAIVEQVKEQWDTVLKLRDRVLGVEEDKLTLLWNAIMSNRTTAAMVGAGAMGLMGYAVYLIMTGDAWVVEMTAIAVLLVMAFTAYDRVKENRWVWTSGYFILIAAGVGFLWWQVVHVLSFLWWT